MANIRAKDILELTPDASRVQLMSEWATELYDCHPFILRPPPTRPEAERKSIGVDSVLCDTCRVSLEYIAYILERYKQDEDDRGDLHDASVITHHRDLNSLRMRAHCHICNWLVRYVGLPHFYEKDGEGEAKDVVFANTQIELCWDPGFAVDKKEEDFGRPRLYFAQFDPRQERTSANYDTIMRLQIWPSLETANLLVENIQTSSDRLGDDRQGQTLCSTPSPCEQDIDGKAENGQHRASVPLESGSHEEDLRDWSGRESNASREDPTPRVERSGHHGENNEQSRSQTSSASLESGNQESDLDDHSDRNSRASGTESNSGDGGFEHDSDGDDHSGHQSPAESFASEESDNGEYWRCGFTGSFDSRNMAVNWLSRCQKNQDGMHNACNESDDTWLPTRLLDVRHALRYNRVRLVTPLKTEDAFETDRSYITLSHCWGAWGSKELPVLSTKNEDERHRIGIELEELPQTFCDAIYVAAWFQGTDTAAFQDPWSRTDCFDSEMAVDRFSLHYPG